MDGILAYMRRFYYETALSPSRYSQVVLKELVDPPQILFGSDFPFAPSLLVAAECRQLAGLDLWSPEVRYGIHRGHALRLFPGRRENAEAVSALPSFEKASLGQRLKRLANRSAAVVASRAQGH